MEKKEDETGEERRGKGRREDWEAEEPEVEKALQS